MKVVFSTLARQSLTEIGDYIAMDNARQAGNFIRSLRTKASEIGHSPRAYALVPRVEHHGIRHKVFRNYVIYYRIEDTHVTIINILHAARDYEKLLFPKP